MDLVKKSIPFYFLCTSLAMTNCRNAPDPMECETIKYGTYRIQNNNTGVATVLTRNGKSQAEVTEGKTDTLQMGVRWINDCEYHLHYISGDPMISDSLKDYAKANPIQVKILKVEKDYYTYKAEIDGLEPGILDTAFRVK